jgi:endoglycosylceramidase
MPLRTIAAATFALCLLAVPQQASAAQRLHLSDRQLLDPYRRHVVLHGMNVSYKIPPYFPNDSQGERTSFNAADVKRLRDWGFNTIRLGVTWKALEQDKGAISDAYVAELAKLVRLAARGGLWVLVDMHQDEWSEKYRGNGAPEWAAIDDGIPFPPASPGHPYDYAQPAIGRAFTNFYENRDGIRDEYVKAFVTVARAMRGEPAVLGYDAINEPSCEPSRPPCGIPPQAEAGGMWLQVLYDSLIPALNAADPNHPVYYEDYFLTYGGYPWTIGQPPNKPWPYTDQGLSYHVYCPHPLRSETDCPDLEKEAVTEAGDQARQTKVFPLMTEFGATDDLAILRRIADFADQAGHGWQYWQYKTYFDPTTSARTSPGASADGESLVDEAGKPKADKVTVLARAYPERIAGDGASWSFDPDKHAFAMKYTARSRRATVIRLPLPVHYPKGYRVTVSGARVASRAGAAQLRLVASKGRRVTVAVAPR